MRHHDPGVKWDEVQWTSDKMYHWVLWEGNNLETYTIINSKMGMYNVENNIWSEHV